jgi:hypothetical protein
LAFLLVIFGGIACESTYRFFGESNL